VDEARTLLERLGIEALGPVDTLFIYTWGHGGCGRVRAG